MPSDPSAEATRRRTFAIISHPDAGKTTLTEKLLLYGGALGREAGAVKARADRRSATSDWMELEQQRGISITSTVLQFPYRDCVVNLLDTPGHRDFSEDTYRVLTACDAAVMVLDAAKGIESQTLKLFEVCRDRGLPILTFINKWDRPGLSPLELIDDVESHLSLICTPVSWPVGIAGDFRGVVDRRVGDFVRFTRTARGATEAPEELVDAARAAEEEGDAWEACTDELELLEGAEHDRELFLAGESTPMFFGSAITNFGVRLLLDAVIDEVPAPTARSSRQGAPRALDAPFSGFAWATRCGSTSRWSSLSSPPSPRSTSPPCACATCPDPSSSAPACSSSTRRVWCRCCATPTSAIRHRCWPRSAPCSSRSPPTASRPSSARRSSSP
jgi:peptide chain release factor 3